jgi:hypothetical protein
MPMNSIFAKMHSPAPDPNQLSSGNTYNTVPTQSLDDSPSRNPPRPSSQLEPPEPMMTEDSSRKTPTSTGGFIFKQKLTTGKIVGHSTYGQVTEPKFICGKPQTPKPNSPTNLDAERIKCDQSICQFMKKHGLADNDNTEILEKYKALSGENTDSYFSPAIPSPVNVYDPTARDKNIEILHALVDKTVKEKKLLISKYDMTLMNEEDVSSELTRIKADIRKRGAKGFGGLAESLHVDCAKFSQPLQKTDSTIADKQRSRIQRYKRFKFMWF